MLRVVRATGPILEGRQSDDASSTTSKIWSDGSYEFRGPGRLYDEVNIYDRNRLIFRGNNNVNVAYIEASSDSQLTIAGFSGKTINLKNLNAPRDNQDAATKIYVDGALAPFITSDEVDTKINNETVHLPLTGGTLTGGLGINMSTNNANGFAFTKGSNTNFTMKFQTDTEARMIVQNGKVFKLNSHVSGVQTNVLSIGTSGNLGLYNLRTPTNPNDAATMAYVDEAVAELAPPDLSVYAQNKFLRAPARLSWKFSSTSSGDSKPTDEYFKITANGNDTYIRFSFYTANGSHLGDSPFSDTNVSIDNGPVGTIWYWHYQDEDWRLKEQFRINSFRWNYNNHFEMRMTSRHGNKSYTSGTAYYITVGGFF